MRPKEYIEKRLAANAELHNLIHIEHQDYLELVTGKEDFEYDDLLGIANTHLGLHVEKAVLKAVLRKIDQEAGE